MPRRFETIGRLIEYFKRMSISGKFVLMYVIVFAVPIFLYAFYSFNSTTRNIQASYNKQSQESLETVFENIARNIDISETVIGTALDNYGFVEFISGDMTQDDLRLIQFKQNEYAQIVNIKNLNPTINNIKFYMDNEGIYPLPPVLQMKADFRDRKLYDRLIQMQGREYFMWNNRDTNPAGAPVKVVSLFRALTNDRRHEGIIEVNMRQDQFFQDLYGNPGENNAMLLLMNHGDAPSLLFNENSSFYKQRISMFDSLTNNLEKHGNKDGESYPLEIAGERFVVNTKYIKNLNSYLVQIYSLEGITGQVRDVRNHILIAVLVALAVLCLVTYLLSSLLLKKLGVVVSSMHKVQAGDLNVVIPVKGGDELDELAGHFNHTLVKIKDLISQLLSKQQAINEAENKALQSQINSHFVYNVLESIRMMAETEERPHISEAIYSLGQMLRYSMKSRVQHVSLAEEIAMVGTYLKLMNIVSDDRVELATAVDKELERCPVPKLSIEPLAENAVVHGIEPNGGRGVVSISVRRSGNELAVAVADDGVGIEPNELELLNEALNEESAHSIELLSDSGIGLFNVHKRVRLLYGSPYGISIESEKNRFTRVVMRLPCKSDIGGW